MGFDVVAMNQTGAELQRSKGAGMQRSRGAGGRESKKATAAVAATAACCPFALRPVRPTARAALFALCASLLLGSCSSRFDPSQYPTPEALYEVSMAAYERGDCGDAEIGFQRLAYDLPARDPRRAEVRFYVAECHFKGNRLLEAAREFRRVADEHSQDSIAPRALLRAGDANARLWRRSELDATYGLTALSVYSEVLSRYPESATAADAREQVGVLNEKFAKKAYDTGIFYFRLKAYDSAILYFREVVADYPQASYAAEALLHLVDAYERIGYEEDKQDMCLQLRRYYPESVVHAPSCVSDTTSA